MAVKRKLLVASLVSLFSIPLLASHKTVDIHWLDGKLLSSSSERECTVDGSSSNGTGSVVEICVIYVSYKVDAGDMIYTLRRDMRFRWDKDLDVTVNAPVKFAIDGRKGYLQDEHGKPHQLYVVQKAKK